MMYHAANPFCLPLCCLKGEVFTSQLKGSNLSRRRFDAMSTDVMFGTDEADHELVRQSELEALGIKRVCQNRPLGSLF